MRTSTVESVELGAIRVSVSKDGVIVDLNDGRTVVAPLAWYPRLVHATARERGHWRLIGGGEGIHWPDLDEDLSVEDLLAGRPSGESQVSLKKWLASRKVPRTTRRPRPMGRRGG